VILNGLYVVSEYCPYEPSAYVHSPQFVVVPEDGEQVDPAEFIIDADEFDKQVWPKTYGRALVQEREAAFAAEDDFNH
jgi:hypothetical protein